MIQHEGFAVYIRSGNCNLALFLKVEQVSVFASEPDERLVHHLTAREGSQLNLTGNVEISSVERTE